MNVTSNLHSPVSHVEKLADLLVLFPVLLLTRLRAVLDGSALDATFDHGMSLAGEAAALGHDNAMEFTSTVAACTFRATAAYSRSRSRGRRIESVLLLGLVCCPAFCLDVVYETRC